MFKLCYKKNDSTLIDSYKKYSNVLTSVKRTAKQNYYYAMIKMNKQNFSKHWQLINQILQRNGKQKHSIRKLITDENALLTDEKEICDELNSFCEYWSEYGVKDKYQQFIRGHQYSQLY